MGTAFEAGTAQQTNIKAALDSGEDVVSNFQEITFVQYIRVVLPLDGYVFWIRSGIASQSALLNAFRLNTVALNQGPTKAMPPNVLVINGDLHYATSGGQDEATSYATNRVVFTAQEEVQALNVEGSDVLYIAEIDNIRFAFASRGFFQENAHTYHYIGDAIYADMETQIIDTPADLDTRSVIVSNSLPLWLAMNGYQAKAFELFGNPNLRLYPSFLLPDNLHPPYAAVHIPPENTVGLAAAPLIGRTASHYQLASDRVRVTLYGERNFNAQTFVDFVMEQSLNYDQFGIMNVPIIRDEKKTQVELNAIAMKKTVEFQISYYQSAMRDITRQLILSAVPTYLPAAG